MALETLCLHNKFGYCKFSETCRKFHMKEICQIERCEVQECLKRHPKICKYYEQYQRCKFGEFCAYSHRSINENVQTSELISDLSSRIGVLERKIEDKDREINDLNEKVKAIERMNLVLKVEITENLEKVVTHVVKESVDNLGEILTQQQENFEKRNHTCFDALQEQVSIIANLFQPSANLQLGNVQQPFHPPDAAAAAVSLNLGHSKQTPSHHCEVCGKTFGSERALNNHTRNDHRPKP